MACAGQFYCEFLDEETDNGGQLVDIGFGGQEYKAVIHEFEESADIAFIKGWYQTQSKPNSLVVKKQIIC
ncbi:hypothetical protein Ahy_B06g086045 isoform G [Arachis hypogaea]|uniref:Uncharacterized protein n=1 Tax=Arachis hypogaea TaxID=3818 RepID=A0A444YWI7_ARAHY|nr:hypothetical protein Ahy_B06g086045 isoform G [Arachis hypogaea]